MIVTQQYLCTIERLWLFNCTTDFDLKILPNLRTLVLFQDDTIIQEHVHSLSFCPKLEKLTIYNGDDRDDNILDISNLAKCPRLWKLKCSEFNECPLKGLQYCQNITHLTITLCLINITELLQLKKLQCLCLEYWEKDLPLLNKLIFKKPHDDVTKCKIYSKFQHIITIQHE